jgi:hypothetical protein
VRARRFPSANKVFRLPGGNEDNDLWAEVGEEQGFPYIKSLWVPSDEEREAIAKGENIALVVVATVPPPVQVFTTAERPGKDGTG